MTYVSILLLGRQESQIWMFLEVFVLRNICMMYSVKIGNRTTVELKLHWGTVVL